MMPMIAWALTRLAGAGLAEDGEGLALVEVPADLVDRVDGAVLGAELHRERVHLEQVAAGQGSDVGSGSRQGHRYRSLGSRASRSASPSRMKHRTVTLRNRLGNSSRCGAVRSSAWPWLICSPQEIAGSCRPMPRNDSVASAAMIVPTAMVE